MLGGDGLAGFLIENGDQIRDRGDNRAATARDQVLVLETHRHPRAPVGPSPFQSRLAERPAPPGLPVQVRDLPTEENHAAGEPNHRVDGGIAATRLADRASDPLDMGDAAEYSACPELFTRHGVPDAGTDGAELDHGC